MKRKSLSSTEIEAVVSRLCRAALREQGFIDEEVVRETVQRIMTAELLELIGQNPGSDWRDLVLRSARSFAAAIYHRHFTRFNSEVDLVEVRAKILRICECVFGHSDADVEDAAHRLLLKPKVMNRILHQPTGWQSYVRVCVRNMRLDRARRRERPAVSCVLVGGDPPVARRSEPLSAAQRVSKSRTRKDIKRCQKVFSSLFLGQVETAALIPGHDHPRFPGYHVDDKRTADYVQRYLDLLSVSAPIADAPIPGGFTIVFGSRVSQRLTDGLLAGAPLQIAEAVERPPVCRFSGGERFWTREKVLLRDGRVVPSREGRSDLQAGDDCLLTFRRYESSSILVVSGRHGPGTYFFAQLIFLPKLLEWLLDNNATKVDFWQALVPLQVRHDEELMSTFPVFGGEVKECHFIGVA